MKNADVSICVLSLPDLLEESTSDSKQNPAHSWRDLVSPDTYFLFNKSDLVASAISGDSADVGALYKRVSGVSSGKVEKHSPNNATREPLGKAWTASLATGAGADQFLAGFGEALQHR